MERTLKECQEDAAQLRREAEAARRDWLKVDNFFEGKRACQKYINADYRAAVARVCLEARPDYVKPESKPPISLWRGLLRSFINGLLLHPFKARR